MSTIARLSSTIVAREQVAVFISLEAMRDVNSRASVAERKVQRLRSFNESARS